MANVRWGYGRDEINAALQVERGQAPRLHEYGIAGADVGQLVFRNLHLDDHAGHIDDPAQLVARTEMLIELALDKSCRDDAADRSADLGLTELLIKNSNLFREPADIGLHLPNLLRPVPRFHQRQLALGLGQLAGLQIRFAVGSLRKSSNGGFDLSDFTLADFHGSVGFIEIGAGGQAVVHELGRALQRLLIQLKLGALPLERLQELVALLLIPPGVPQLNALGLDEFLFAVQFLGARPRAKQGQLAAFGLKLAGKLGDLLLLIEVAQAGQDVAL